MSRFMALITSGVKYSMFFFNLLFVITGLVILIIGAVIQSEYYKYQPFLDNQFFSLPSFLIAIGSLIFIIAFFGCCGAVKENYCMVLTFAILMVMIFIFELAAGISGYILRGRATTVITQLMFDSMNLYNTSMPMTKLWDEVQNDFECCGTNQPDDWMLKTSATNHTLPISCCNIAGSMGMVECNLNTTTLHNFGCVPHIADWAGSHAGTLGSAGMVLAIIQILGIVFACHLAKRTKYETMA